MASSKLSVVVYSDGNPEGIVRVLKSFEYVKQDAVEFEVILVYKGINEKVERLIADSKRSFSTSLVSVTEKSCRGAGRNLGVAKAKYDIILFLDSELECSPDLLIRHTDAYEDINTVAVMGEQFLPRFVKKSRWYRFLDSDYRSTRRWARQEKTDTSPPLRYVNTSNFSVRKHIYEACGGHSEDIHNHEAENIDLAHRISALNKGVIHYEAEAVAFCQHPPFKDSLKARYEFGKEGIPKLLEAYPELYNKLPSRFVKMSGFSMKTPLLNLFFRIFFTRPFLFVARGLRLFGPEFIAFWMIRYMLQYESVSGFKNIRNP